MCLFGVQVQHIIRNNSSERACKPFEGVCGCVCVRACVRADLKYSAVYNPPGISFKY